MRVRRDRSGGVMFFFHFYLFLLLFSAPLYAQPEDPRQPKRNHQLRRQQKHLSQPFVPDPDSYFSKINIHHHDDFQGSTPSHPNNDDITTRETLRPAILDSISVLQSQFFELWEATWPTASDWIAALMSSHLSASLSVMSRFQSEDLENLDRPLAGEKGDGEHGRVNEIEIEKRRTGIRETENKINLYFTQLSSFYFGQNAFMLRFQAYDDMLWVVLGWLESIKFVERHSSRFQHHHHPIGSAQPPNSNSSQGTKWYGHQFIPQFAHRARIFYDLASQGWDTTLCEGGMIWSPYLNPYKNAITNQLFIAASVGMYLGFPGDGIDSPFVLGDALYGGEMQRQQEEEERERKRRVVPPARARDPKYLTAAIDAYAWLRKSNMRNEKGLYTDGFHIQDWTPHHNDNDTTTPTSSEETDTFDNQKCNIRNEKIYTYNQGVLLSGLRGLYLSTGLKSYLDDGHELIQNVISATGWHTRSGGWAGLGRNGILEEECDASGTCNQDGLTFKGVFFLHLGEFCADLDDNDDRPAFHSSSSSNPGSSFSSASNPDSDSEIEVAQWHHSKCKEYKAWILHNAQAAYGTRDQKGVFGAWWGAGAGRPGRGGSGIDKDGEQGGGGEDGAGGAGVGDVRDEDDNDSNEEEENPNESQDQDENKYEETTEYTYPNISPHHSHHPQRTKIKGVRRRCGDPNQRGLGRTAETQSGGVAVLGALWAFL